MKCMYLEVSPASCFGFPLHCVLQCVYFFNSFFNSVFPVKLTCARRPYMGMPAQCCARPLFHSAQTPLRSALCFMDFCQHFAQDGSKKVLFFFAQMKDS